MRSRTAILALVLLVAGCTNGGAPSSLTEVQRVRAGNLDVVVLSADGTLTHGKDAFVLEFRSRDNQQLVDVGAVKVNATMIMAGMPPMIGETTVARGSTTGRYEVATALGMAGTWRVGLEWDGPAGRGATVVQGNVQ